MKENIKKESANRELIIVKPEKCVGCNACVRTCPAPEANITKQLENGKFVTTVDASKCIACGECVRTCTHGARDYIDDTTEAMNHIGRQKMIVIAAPAIKSVFPKKWKSILNWFRKQGCLVFDVAFGADICTWAHLRALQQERVKNVITQPCAAIVKYIETYQPKLLRNLSPIHSPMLCAVTYIKKYLNYSYPVLALSPCIAKKNEFVETGLVEYNVTFKKLMEYFSTNGINIFNDNAEDFKYDFNGEQGQVGGIYPRAGGLRDNLWLHDPELNITTSEGVHKVYPELDLMANMNESMLPQVFDVLSCEFGCNVGAGTGSTKTIFEVMKTMRDVEQEAKSRRKTSGGFFRGAEDKLFKRFDEELVIQDFMRNYGISTPTRVPTLSELAPVFEKMGKHTDAERHYDCHACGYRSCQDMATAIFRGLNTPNNCIVHAKNVLIANHSKLTEKHEKLSDITDRCKTLSEKMQNDMTKIKGNMSIIRNANGSTNNHADKVHSLLADVVKYCESNDSMDKNETAQLIQILKTVLSAFDSLYDSVKQSTGSTLSVDSYVLEIDNLVADINATLTEVETV